MAFWEQAVRSIELISFIVTGCSGTDVTPAHHDEQKNITGAL